MAYYYTGSSRDLQSRRAVIAQDRGQINGLLPLLATAGVAPVGDSTLATRLAPNGRPPTRERTWVSALAPRLIGVESVPPGDQWTLRPPHHVVRSRARDYTLTVPPSGPLLGAAPAPVGDGTLATRLAPIGSARARDYSFSASLFPGLIGTDAVNPGEQFTDLPPRGKPKALDYSYIDPTETWLIGADELNPGEQATDLPPRAAPRERDYSWAWPAQTQLIGQDALPVGDQVLPPHVVARTRDYTWLQSFSLPTYAELPFGASTQTLPPSTAARARDYTFTQTLFASLIGQDATNPGIQSAELPSRSTPRSREYSIATGFPPVLIGQDAMATGAQAVDLPPKTAARQRHYTWVQSVSLPVFAELPFGVSTDRTTSPPWTAARARDYTFEASFPPVLVGADAMATGTQLSGNAPAGRPRATTLSEPGTNFTLALAADTAVNLLLSRATAGVELPPRGAQRSRDYTFTYSAQIQLFGADAMVTGQQSTANPPRGAARAATLSEPGYNLTVWLDLANQAFQGPGQSTARTELPPRAYPRSRDYSFVDQYEQVLVGQDALPIGEQLSGNATAGPRRSPDYTWTQSFALSVFQQLLPGAQATELAPRALARARDYTWQASLPVPLLIGQDALTTGVQSYELPPKARPRAATLSEPGINLTIWVDLAIQPVQGPGQSALRTILPPRAYVRSRDYSYTASTFLGLVGADAMVTGDQSTALPPRGPQRAASLSDPLQNLTLIPATSIAPVGEQVTDLPPKAAPRSRDYTFLDQTRRQLIGQDAMAAGDSTYATELPPRGSARSKDYTWLQSAPLHIFQQLPPGQSTAKTEGPPRGPLRSRDYTFLDLTKPQLIGQDRMYGAPGEVPAYDWQLPTPAPKRLRDYTYLLRFDMSQAVASQHPGTHVLSDRALFIHTLTDSGPFVHTLSDRALFLHTVTDSVGIL